MNEAESLSMTPPLSPEGFSLGELEPSPPNSPRLTDEQTRVVCFHCLGEVSAKDGGALHCDGYWKSGYLHRLYSNPSRDALPINQPMPLLPAIFIQNSNSDKVFLILSSIAIVGCVGCRGNYHRDACNPANCSAAQCHNRALQQIGEIQTSAVKSRLSYVLEDNVDAQEIRKQTCSFLQYLMDYIQSNTVTEDCVSRLLPELHSLLLHIGRLSELPHHVIQSSSTGSKSSITHQCLHLHLDIYWRILSILHILQIKFPGYRYNSKLCLTPDNDNDSTLYEQMLHIVLWDLVVLAHVRYIDKVVNQDPQNTAMFSCSCVKELWLLILRLTEWRSSNHIGESFWISLHHVLKLVMDTDNQEVHMEVEDCMLMLNPPKGFEPKEPVGLCLWIMYNVAPLYTQTVPGSMMKEGSAVSNYHDLQTVMKKLLSSPGLTEPVLRRHLRTCLLLTSRWEPNTNILITLWDFFYKRLNQSESYQCSSGMLDGLACVDQSVISMYERCKQWTQAHCGSLDRETSYQLFLRLLSLQLGKLYSSGSTQEWKQVKGRIYSKFHARRVQELMEGGLYNLTTLFITLGMTADLEDVASKLCDFYDMLDIHSITFAKRCVIWRGAFTLMLVYIERDMDVTFLADRMLAAFENAVSEFGTAGIDTRHCVWKLIVIYLEGLQEVVEASRTLQLSEYKLLCPAVHTLLSVCSEHELRSTLSTLHSVVQKFRQVRVETGTELLSSVRGSLQHAEFGSGLWRTVYSFIVEHAQTLTPPPIVADIAASFCLLSLTCPSDDKTMTSLKVFQTFAASDKVCVSISCRFLTHLLSCSEMMTRIQSDLNNHESFIISAWFRCSLCVPTGSQMLVEITRPVLQLKEVQEILHQSGIDNIEDIDQAPVVFLKALEKAHSKIQNWQEKMIFQKQIIAYFSDVQKHIAPVLKSMCPSEVVNNVYKMTGYLIKHCAKLIYVRQDVIVPSLISTLIVPHHVLNPDKPLNPVFLAAVRDNLHLIFLSVFLLSADDCFIQGLSKLPYDRDPFVQRRLRDIVCVYLPKFSLRSSSVSMTVASVTTVHPVVASLSGSFIQNPMPDSIKFRHYMIQIVISNFIVVKNMTVHQNHNSGLSFIHDVVQRTTSTDVKARDVAVLLPLCLEYLLLLSNNSSSWTSVLETLQRVCDAYRRHRQCRSLSEVTGLCGQFVSSYFKFSSVGVLRLMEKLAVLLPDVVVSVLDKLSECVKDIEKKRGVGFDQKLRGQYYQVLKLLGERGSEEMHNMQSGVS